MFAYKLKNTKHKNAEYHRSSSKLFWYVLWCNVGPSVFDIVIFLDIM